MFFHAIILPDRFCNDREMPRLSGNGKRRALIGRGLSGKGNRCVPLKPHAGLVGLFGLTGPPKEGKDSLSPEYASYRKSRAKKDERSCRLVQSVVVSGCISRRKAAAVSPGKALPNGRCGIDRDVTRSGCWLDDENRIFVESRKGVWTL